MVLLEVGVGAEYCIYPAQILEMESNSRTLDMSSFVPNETLGTQFDREHW